MRHCSCSRDWPFGDQNSIAGGTPASTAESSHCGACFSHWALLRNLLWKRTESLYKRGERCKALTFCSSRAHRPRPSRCRSLWKTSRRLPLLRSPLPLRILARCRPVSPSEGYFLGLMQPLGYLWQSLPYPLDPPSVPEKRPHSSATSIQQSCLLAPVTYWVDSTISDHSGLRPPLAFLDTAAPAPRNSGGFILGTFYQGWPRTCSSLHLTCSLGYLSNSLPEPPIWFLGRENSPLSSDLSMRTGLVWHPPQRHHLDE